MMVPLSLLAAVLVVLPPSFAIELDGDVPWVVAGSAGACKQLCVRACACV